MPRLSNSLRLDIWSSIFAYIVALLIFFGVYLTFRWGGLGAQAQKGLTENGLPMIGVFALFDAYRFWKKHKAERERSNNG